MDRQKLFLWEMVVFLSSVLFQKSTIYVVFFPFSELANHFPASVSRACPLTCITPTYFLTNHFTAMVPSFRCTAWNEIPRPQIPFFSGFSSILQYFQGSSVGVTEPGCAVIAAQGFTAPAISLLQRYLPSVWDCLAGKTISHAQ